MTAVRSKRGWTKSHGAVKVTNKITGGIAEPGQLGRMCPTCKTLIGIRNDGKLKAHRIRPSGGRTSWPCRGEDEGLL